MSPYKLCFIPTFDSRDWIKYIVQSIYLICWNYVNFISIDDTKNENKYIFY